ncbi:MAG: hypothetical protein ABSF26_24710 [Thermoguttaceae bacterium]
MNAYRLTLGTLFLLAASICRGEDSEARAASTTNTVHMPNATGAATSAQPATNTNTAEAPKTTDAVTPPSFFWPTINVFASLLGGGLGSALVSFWANSSIERRRRRIDHLDSQLRNLYGPLQFFVSGSQSIYKRAWTIEQAMHAEYGGENAAKHSPQGRTDEINASIAVNNEYFALAKENSRHIVKILTDNYYLMEPEDAEVFGQFQDHHVRGKTELHESGGLKLPYDVYKKIGDIYCLDPKFAELVNRRFSQKKMELARLIR